MNITIHDIDEIRVVKKDGQTVTFRKSGLEKFRKMMVNSPPLSQQPIVSVIEEDDSEDDIPEEPIQPVRGSKKVCAGDSCKQINQPSFPTRTAGPSYENKGGFNYAVSSGNPYELAKRMVADARSSGVHAPDFGRDI